MNAFLLTTGIGSMLGAAAVYTTGLTGKKDVLQGDFMQRNTLQRQSWAADDGHRGGGQQHSAERVLRMRKTPFICSLLGLPRSKKGA